MLHKEELADVSICVVDENQKQLEGIALQAEFFDEAEDRWIGTTTLNTDHKGYAYVKDYNSEWSFFISVEGQLYGKFSCSEIPILIRKAQREYNEADYEFFTSDYYAWRKINS